MTTVSPPMCLVCKHYIGPKGDSETCRAFSEIPDEIFYEAYDHRRVYPGDRGIRFEPVNPDSTKTVDSIWGSKPSEEIELF